MEGEIIEDQALNNDMGSRNYFTDLQSKFEVEETSLFEKTFPILEHLLEAFKRNPDVLENEDRLKTSPGTVLHYFARINYIDGVKVLLKEPFLVYPNTLKKRHFFAQITRNALFMDQYYLKYSLYIVILSLSLLGSYTP